ncbi:hypothetical protein [Ekhidna sp.]|uniref:hypothetical protein n=1 Tax=Ekhidna sp. TaxID=2608089 RepID=UPI003B5110FA
MQSEIKEEKSSPLNRKDVPPANEDDQQKFWKELRHFYRTGEKPDNSSINGLSSIFCDKLAIQSNPYPISFEKEKIDFSSFTTNHIIDTYLSVYQSNIISQFKYKLKTVITSLSRILDIETADASSSEGYDFASEIIAFDKLSKLVPKHSGPALSASRKNRLQEVLDLLNDGLHQYQTAQAVLLTTPKYGDQQGFKRFQQINVKENTAVKETKKLLEKQLTTFVELMKAFRIASLEVEDDYDEKIHDDYFTHFTWYRLSNVEKVIFRPIILQIDHQLIMQQLDDLSELLSTNWPIKLLVMNHLLVSEPVATISWEEASHRYRPELAALTVAHRNVATYQLTTTDPGALIETIQNWIQMTQPAMMHLLVPNDENEFINVKAAVYGRYFPTMTYNLSGEQSAPSKWKIDQNPDPVKKWPLITFEIAVNDKIIQQPIAFTYADYKAFFNSKLNELMLVPPAYDSDYLVSLSSYMELSQEELIGKIPYIWLVDEGHNLHRAAVPNVWVVSCQERLDNWNFLQEMAGSSSTVVLKSDDQVEPEISEDQLKVIKEEATRTAATRLINELLSEA